MNGFRGWPMDGLDYIDLEGPGQNIEGDGLTWMFFTTDSGRGTDGLECVKQRGWCMQLLGLRGFDWYRALGRTGDWTKVMGWGMDGLKDGLDRTPGQRWRDTVRQRTLRETLFITAFNHSILWQNIVHLFDATMHLFDATMHLFDASV